jgi:hypothetical protein
MSVNVQRWNEQASAAGASIRNMKAAVYFRTTT